VKWQQWPPCCLQHSIPLRWSTPPCWRVGVGITLRHPCADCRSYPRWQRLPGASLQTRGACGMISGRWPRLDIEKTCLPAATGHTAARKEMHRYPQCFAMTTTFEVANRPPRSQLFPGLGRLDDRPRIAIQGLGQFLGADGLTDGLLWHGVIRPRAPDTPSGPRIRVSPGGSGPPPGRSFTPPARPTHRGDMRMLRVAAADRRDSPNATGARIHPGASGGRQDRTP
jgi:hypothetical protein